MIKLSEAFQNKKAFIAYLMAGDPNLEVSADYILAAQDAGADIIEIGIPFSDPIAEGEIVEAASVRALQAGTRLDGVFKMVDSLKDKMRIPMVFMTYCNPVFVFGYDKFFARCAEIGVSGVIIPDLPFEAQGEAKSFARKHDVAIITLVAPTTDARLGQIAANVDGLMYLVPAAGTPDTGNAASAELLALIEKLRALTQVPIAVGIASQKQAAQYGNAADGVIVGNPILRIVERFGAGAKQPLVDYIREMKGAMAR